MYCIIFKTQKYILFFIIIKQYTVLYIDEYISVKPENLDKNIPLPCH